MRLFVTLSLFVAACDGDGAPSGGGGGAADAAPSSDSVAGDPDAAVADVDLDGDGLLDGDEQALAEAYLPFLSLHPDDGCTQGGILYRARKHPEDPTRVHIIYDHLFETDCGIGGHVGDNEVFGVTIDPAVPPPEGILAIRTISHQSTACQQTNECGAACGFDDCELQEGWPVVFSSRGKHGGYLSRTRCNYTTCLDQCAMNSVAIPRPLVNAGEPDAQLVNDLTTQAFINEANGWTEAELFGFDPWSDTRFGSAGTVAEDLVDDAFLTPPCP